MLAPRAIASTVAVTVLLAFTGLLGPAGVGVVLLAMPLPGLALGGIGGVQAAAIATALSAFVIAATLGVDVACCYVALVGVPVVLTVSALGRGWRIESVVMLAVGAVLSSAAGLVLLYGGGVAAVQSGLTTTWDESFSHAIEMYRGLGMDEEQLSDVESQRAELQRSLLTLLPSLAAMAGGIVWFVNVRLAQRWGGWPQLVNLTQWQAPPWLIWVLIATGFSMFAPVETLAIGARNVFAVVLAAYFCQGLAIVSYFLKRLGLPPGLRVASYILIGLQQIVAGLVLMLGVFDFWGNFRRIGVPADVDSE